MVCDSSGGKKCGRKGVRLVALEGALAGLSLGVTVSELLVEPDVDLCTVVNGSLYRGCGCDDPNGVDAIFEVDGAASVSLADAVMEAIPDIRYKGHSFN